MYVVYQKKNVGAIILIIFWWCLQKYRRTRQIEAARSGSTNSTSRIDSVARMLFPLSFGLFNMAYWYSYFQAQKPFDWGDHMLKGQFHEKLSRDRWNFYIPWFWTCTVDLKINDKSVGCLYSVRYKMGNKLAIRCLTIEKNPSYRVEFQ